MIKAFFLLSMLSTSVYSQNLLAMIEPQLPIRLEDLSFVKGFRPETLQGGRFDLVDSPSVKIWISTIVKGAGLKPHRHLQGRWVIPLEDAVVYKRYNRRAQLPIGKVEWKKNQTYYYPADPENVYHNDENHSDRPVQVMVVSFRDEKEKPLVEEMKADFDTLDDRDISTAEVEGNFLNPSR